MAENIHIFPRMALGSEQARLLVAQGVIEFRALPTADCEGFTGVVISWDEKTHRVTTLREYPGHDGFQELFLRAETPVRFIQRECSDSQIVMKLN